MSTKSPRGKRCEGLRGHSGPPAAGHLWGTRKAVEQGQVGGDLGVRGGVDGAGVDVLRVPLTCALLGTGPRSGAHAHMLFSKPINT